MNAVSEFTRVLFEGWSLPLGVLLLGLMVLFTVVGYLLTFVSAFLHIAKPNLRGAVTTCLAGLLFALVLGGGLSLWVPDLVSELSAWGLFSVCIAVSSLVIGVPVMQAFWHTGYFRALSSLVCTGLVVTLIVFTTRELLQPSESSFARPIMEFFE